MLDLEEKIKTEIDRGLSIWCEPVGDKSKLRQLRRLLRLRSHDGEPVNENNKHTGVDTADGKLILGSHKLSYHYDRVEAWEAGEKNCSDQCRHGAHKSLRSDVFLLLCHGPRATRKSQYQNKGSVKPVDDFAEIGVKSVSLISDGESTFRKHMCRSYNIRRMLVSMWVMQQTAGSGIRIK